MLLVDWTHMARRASGIERITRELFSAEALSPLPVTAVTGQGSRAVMMAQQQFALPARALGDRVRLWFFQGIRRRCRSRLCASAQSCMSMIYFSSHGRRI